MSQFVLPANPSPVRLATVERAAPYPLFLPLLLRYMSVHTYTPKETHIGQPSLSEKRYIHPVWVSRHLIVRLGSGTRERCGRKGKKKTPLFAFLKKDGHLLMSCWPLSVLRVKASPKGLQVSTLSFVLCLRVEEAPKARLCFLQTHCPTDRPSIPRGCRHN